jgi:hypothetical protein
MRSKLPQLVTSIVLLVGLSASSVVAQQAFGVKSVGSVRTQAGATEVHIVYDRPVDPATGTNTANYTFGAGVTPVANGARLLTGLPKLTDPNISENRAPVGRIFDNECVIMAVTGLAPGASSSVTIQNVKDTQNNTITTVTKDFTDSGYIYVDTGVPPGPGKVVAIGTNGFDIYNNGRTQWSDEDQTTLVYKQVSGDFDLQARVEFLDWASRWSRAGIMAREDLNAGDTSATQDTSASRYIDIHVNPVRAYSDTAAGMVAGNNQYESHYRDTKGGETASGAYSNPTFPNAWVRITRTNLNIYTWRSTNGVDWISESGWRRTVASDWKSSLYLGPAFSAETGNINAANGTAAQDRFYLMQLRWGAIVTPIVTAFDPNPYGFVAKIVDSQTAVNPTTVKASNNGQAITVSATKQANVTTVVYTSANPIPVGSTNQYVLEYQDNAAPAANLVYGTTVVAAYGDIPADYRIASATGEGMVLRTHQLPTGIRRSPGTENSTGAAEQQLANGIVNASGQPYANYAFAAGDGPFSGLVNWNCDRNNPDIGANPPYPDNFNSAEPPGRVVANTEITSIPGTDVNWYGSYTLEITGYLELKKGWYRMGVNSDDGFKLTIGKNAGDIFGVLCGEYNGGRGAADSIFDIAVPADGYYPFRLVNYNGGGNLPGDAGNVEWFVVDPLTGEKYLVNDTTQGTKTVRTYQTASGRAYVKSLLPANTYNGAPIKPTIRAEIVNGTTSLVAGSVKLYLDGTQVTPTVSGGVVTYTVPSPFSYDTTHSGALVWTESTTPQTVVSNAFTFSTPRVSPELLPANSFWIEAEDYDYGGGQTVAAASTMPYRGGGYSNLLATLNVDYFDNQNEALTNADGTATGINFYRGDRRPNNVDHTYHYGAQLLATNRPGPFMMSANFRLGWMGDFWGNYTRTIPAGSYRAYAALSIDNAATVMRAPLDQVTAGVGTTSQTLENLGYFRGTGSSAWGQSVLVPLRAGDSDSAPLGAVKFTGGPVTLRVTATSGDYDWFVFAPATDIRPTFSTGPGNLAQVRRDAKITARIEDFSVTANTNTIRVVVNGVDVTAASAISKSGDVTTVTYGPALWDADTTNSYSIWFTDNGTPTLSVTNSATFFVGPYPTPDTFLIEAEDYDYDGGKFVTNVVNTMPYTGAAYSNLIAKVGIDYNESETADFAANGIATYRGNSRNLATNANFNLANMNDNIGGQWGRDRGTWNATVNYKIGWVGGGDWFNYTRTFPNKNYEVWVAISNDQPLTSPTDTVRAHLSWVTSGAGTTNQTIQPLGIFRYSGTAGWGNNRLVPMRDTNTLAKVVLPLSGQQTVRLNADAGDLDYLLFVPTTAAPPVRIDKISVNAQGQIVIEWTGAGTVQKAGTLPTTPQSWTDVPGASPLTVPPPASGQEYYRLKQ